MYNKFKNASWYDWWRKTSNMSDMADTAAYILEELSDDMANGTMEPDSTMEPDCKLILSKNYHHFIILKNLELFGFRDMPKPVFV